MMGGRVSRFWETRMLMKTSVWKARFHVMTSVLCSEIDYIGIYAKFYWENRSNLN